ncbi:P4H4 [Symbiodinium sp. CCMP2456]|nr:P4H4 [Symbiodinium sp. CCMP2456]
MTLHISACLMSGRTADLELPPDASVSELRRRAQEALGVNLSSVVSSAGAILQDQEILAEAVQDGGSVTVHTRAKSLAAASIAQFVAICGNGSVESYTPHVRSHVQARLKNVQCIQAAVGESFDTHEDEGEEEEEEVMLEESPEEEQLDDDEDWMEEPGEGEEEEGQEEEEEEQEEVSPVQTAEAASRASLLLLFEGGEFQYPAVHLGFRRSVALGVGARVAELRTLSLRPVVFSVEGFADGSERRSLKKLAKPLLKKSEVRQFDNHPADGDQSFRSSWSAFLPAEEPLVSLIMNRSQLLTKVSGRVENLQVMRYRPGQQYQAHWDFFDPEYFKKQPEVLGRLTHRRNRLLTMLFYLASSAEGGQTAFPMAYGAPRPADPEDCSSWLQVPAKRGKAVLFYNLHADGRLDRSSNHAGCKVQAGEKWSANIWAWNSKNQEIMDPDLDDEL